MKRRAQKPRPKPRPQAGKPRVVRVYFSGTHDQATVVGVAPKKGQPPNIRYAMMAVYRFSVDWFGEREGITDPAEQWDHFANRVTGMKLYDVRKAARLIMQP